MSREHYTKCVENGVNKINYYTGMLLNAGLAVKVIAAEKEKLLLTDVTKCIFSSVYKTVSEAISFFWNAEFVRANGAFVISARK